MRDFESICDIVSTGRTLKEVCAAKGLKVSQFQEFVLRRPACRARWTAAKARGKAARLAAGHLRHADAILLQMEAGQSLRDICAGDSRFPHRQAFARALDWDPALRARYDAAIAKWSAPHVRSLIHFDEIEQRIIAGGAIVEILASHESFPDDCSWRNFFGLIPTTTRDTAPRSGHVRPVRMPAALRHPIPTAKCFAPPPIS